MARGCRRSPPPSALRMPDRAEVDVLGVVLVVEARRQQPHDMHAGQAAVAGQLAHGRAAALGLGNVGDQLA